MKKVLIIGSRGMLGSELVRMFGKNKDYTVVGWDFDDIDITNKSAVKKKIAGEKPNIIINAAAYNAVDKAEESEKEFEKAKKVNGEGPKFLAQTAKENDAMFVQYVTDYLFDGKKGEYTEEDRPCPISNYGVSKAIGEKNVREIRGKFYLIRTSKLFGNPAQSENSKKSFFEIMFDLAKEKKEIKAIDSERSCFTYVPDLAKATKQLVEKEYRYGIYHLVNEGVATWYEGALELFKIAGINDVKVVPVDPNEFPRPAKRAASSVLINTKFPKLRHYKEAIKEWLNLA